MSIEFQFTHLTFIIFRGQGQSQSSYLEKTFSSYCRSVWIGFIGLLSNICFSNGSASAGWGFCPSHVFRPPGRCLFILYRVILTIGKRQGFSLWMNILLPLLGCSCVPDHGGWCVQLQVEICTSLTHSSHSTQQHQWNLHLHLSVRRSLRVVYPRLQHSRSHPSMPFDFCNRENRMR